MNRNRWLVVALLLSALCNLYFGYQFHRLAVEAADLHLRYRMLVDRHERYVATANNAIDHLLKSSQRDSGERKKP